MLAGNKEAHIEDLNQAGRRKTLLAAPRVVECAFETQFATFYLSSAQIPRSSSQFKRNTVRVSEWLAGFQIVLSALYVCVCTNSKTGWSQECWAPSSP